MTTLCWKRPTSETPWDQALLNYRLNAEWIDQHLGPQITEARQRKDFATADRLKAFATDELGLEVQCYPTGTFFWPT